MKPLGFRLDDRSLQRSGLDYHDLADVKVHANFEACLLGAAQGARVFAVETGGTADVTARCVPGRGCDAVRLGDARAAGGGAGAHRPRARGCTFRCAAKSRSINLSNAVAIVIFEPWRQLGYGGGTILGRLPRGGPTRGPRPGASCKEAQADAHGKVRIGRPAAGLTRASAANRTRRDPPCG